MSQNESQSWYAINQQEGSDEAEIRIFDVIGGWGITADQFVGDLKQFAGIKKIHLRLNTPGGEVFDGTAIYNVLRAFPAEVIVHIDGVAASAGSFIAMSGSQVRMADNAYLMIHNSRGGVMGEADDMRRYADVLEKMNENIAGMYQRKAGKTTKHWRNLMDAETWFTAAEAKAEGLIDYIDKSEKPISASNKANFDFAIYNKIPDPIRKVWGLPQITNVQANTESPRGESAPAPTRKESAMADTPIESPPAQTPAAVTTGVPQGGPMDDVRSINQDTLNKVFEEGRQAGIKEAVKAQLERMELINEACPDQPALAIKSFLKGQDPETVKMTYEAVITAKAEVERKAKEDYEAAQKEIARLTNISVSGGHKGVSMAIGAAEETASRLPPKQQAEWEWEHKPSVRATASSKEIYVIARTAELDGTHRSFARETAVA